jgi:hypothetical protein
VPLLVHDLAPVSNRQARKAARAARASKPPPPQHELRIGGTVIPQHDLRDLKLTQQVNNDATLTVTIPLAVDADMRGEVVFGVVGGGKDGLHFEGWVTKAEPNDVGIAIEARSAPWLDEGTFKGWYVKASPFERAYSMARMVGLRPEQIHIQGLELPRDGFLVVAPLVDVVLIESVHVGSVILTAESPLIEQLLDFVDDPEYRAEFLEPGVWAMSSRMYGRTLFESERFGLSEIDGALDRLVLDAHYSSTTLPGGDRRPFDRLRRFGDPRRTDQVVVRAQSGRAWQRTPGLAYAIQPARATGVLELPFPGDQPEYDLALSAWRRAVMAVDRRAAAVALWEAIEFYAAGAQLEHAFTEQQLAAVQTAAISVADLSDDQRQRVGMVLRQFLNQPPATDRLIACLIRDRIPHTDLELAAVRRLRGPRSRAQHGKQSPEPTEEDLELAVGVVNRILAYWGKRLAEATERR